MYSNEKNVLILLSLLKAHGIKKMVLSPGSANASFVASAQCDPDFELYSSIDERSAAYIACGLAEESGESIVICCTGATASRNYMPGLTEAYYRKLPIIAITATRPLVWLGQNKDQLIDRTVVPKDLVLKSVHLPIVKDEDDAWECNLKINDVLLEAKRNGNGPVHINLTTSYSIDFSVKELPIERVIKRYNFLSKLPPLPKGSIAIFVGAHSKWSNELTNYVDTFCEKYDAFVLYDQTSNYVGKYGIPCGIFNITGFPYNNINCLIHIGNVSASNPMQSMQVWRVNSDGEIRDTFKKLTSVFELKEEEFFKYYSSLDNKGPITTNFNLWNKRYNDLCLMMLNFDGRVPFSSLWIAQNLYDRIPKDSVIHFGILNSLRCWNCYKLDKTIRGYSNTGGFGIDGGVSSLIGASLVNKNKIYFGIFGDLAFFYDINSLGNRHIGSNIRIIVVNNGLGGEFKNILGNVQKAGLGDSANEYISACGHYGVKSRSLVKHFAQDLGFEYMCAENKDDFIKIRDYFVNPKLTHKPLLFEIFVDDHEDVNAISFLQSEGLNVLESNNIIRKTKKIAKKILGNTGIKKLSHSS